MPCEAAPHLASISDCFRARIAGYSAFGSSAPRDLPCVEVAHCKDLEIAARLGDGPGAIATSERVPAFYREDQRGANPRVPLKVATLFVVNTSAAPDIEVRIERRPEARTNAFDQVELCGE